MTRLLSFAAITVLIAAAVTWLLPLDIILGARGYSAQESAAMHAATQPQPDVPCTPEDSQTNENSQANVGNESSSAPDYAAEPPVTTQASSATEPKESTSPPARKIVATSTVNVRAGQGTNFDIVGQFKPQEVVTVVEDPDGDWLKVKGDSVSGWVYRPLFERR